MRLIIAFVYLINIVYIYEDTNIIRPQGMSNHGVTAEGIKYCLVS